MTAPDWPGVPVLSTHGCRLNAYESHAMAAMAKEAGLEDTVIVNTCAVTDRRDRTISREMV